MAFNKEQLQNSAVADLFAISYCQLCEISYAPPSKVCSLVPTVKPLGQGAWQCIWGPTWDAEDANLVFIAVRNLTERFFRPDPFQVQPLQKAENHSSLCFL